MNKLKLDSTSFNAKLIAGRITFETPGYLQQTLSKYYDCPVHITVERVKSRRSWLQNRYYWACLEYIARNLDDSYSKDELHRMFSQKFLPRRPLSFKGVSYDYPISTKELSKGEMIEYLMNIEMDVGFALPNPDAYYQTLFNAPPPSEDEEE